MSPLGSGSVLKAAGTRTGVPSKVVQGFQPVFAKPNMFFGAGQAHHVDAQGVEQVGRDLAEHLVGLGHLDRRAGRIELQGLAQLIDALTCMPVTGAGPEVQGHVVGLLVAEGRFDALAGVHGE